MNKFVSVLVYSSDLQKEYVVPRKSFKFLITLRRLDILKIIDCSSFYKSITVSAV